MSEKVNLGDVVIGTLVSSAVYQGFQDSLKAFSELKSGQASRIINISGAPKLVNSALTLGHNPKFRIAGNVIFGLLGAYVLANLTMEKILGKSLDSLITGK